MPRHKPRGESALRPFWSGTLSFGLVSIPVDLYAGTRDGGTHLRMLAPDGTPLARRYYCPDENIELDADQLARGYESRPGEYVVVTDAELESVEPEKSRDIDLRLFVAADEIDPVYFERSFFLAPAGDSKKAYHLLVLAMERSKRAGIATCVMRDKEYLVAILTDGGWLRAHTLRFADELRSFPTLASGQAQRQPKAAVAAIERVIERNTQAQLDPESLRSQAHEKLFQLVQEKVRRKRDVVEHEDPEPDQGAQIIDLMEALKRSLNESTPKPSSGSPATRRATSSKRRLARR